MPPEFLQFIKDIHTMRQQQGQKIIAWAFSRGSRWLEDIVREHSMYLDVAVFFAGYPANRSAWDNAKAAAELIDMR